MGCAGFGSWSLLELRRGMWAEARARKHWSWLGRSDGRPVTLDAGARGSGVAREGKCEPV